MPEAPLFDRLAWQRARRLACKEAGLCYNCGVRKARPERTCCEHCLLAVHARARRHRERLTQAALTAYGGAVCRCCGEEQTAFLVLDHIGNDGAQQRRSVGDGPFYQHLKRLGWPPGLQVLCSNCNLGKARKGTCPHQEKEEGSDDYQVEGRPN